MNCAQVRGMLADYSVGLLKGRRAGAVERHLAACSECAGELRALQRTGELLELLPAAAPPDNLWAGLAQSLARERSTRLRPGVVPLWLRPAVALAIMVIAALGIWHPWARELPPTPPAVTSSYVQVHLARAPTDVLGLEASHGLLLATAGEIER